MASLMEEMLVKAVVDPKPTVDLKPTEEKEIIDDQPTEKKELETLKTYVRSIVKDEDFQYVIGLWYTNIEGLERRVKNEQDFLEFHNTYTKTSIHKRTYEVSSNSDLAANQISHLMFLKEVFGPSYLLEIVNKEWLVDPLIKKKISTNYPETKEMNALQYAFHIESYDMVKQLFKEYGVNQEYWQMDLSENETLVVNWIQKMMREEEKETGLQPALEHLLVKVESAAIFAPDQDQELLKKVRLVLESTQLTNKEKIEYIRSFKPSSNLKNWFETNFVF